MNKTIEAIYEDGVLKPLGDLGLEEHERVRVNIEPSDGGSERRVEILLKAIQDAEAA